MRYLFAISLALLLAAIAHADEAFHLMPDAVYQKMVDIAQNKDKPTSDSLKEVRNLICNGTKARFFVKHSATYTPVKTTGMLVEEVAAHRQRYLRGLRDYMRAEYFFEASGGDYNGGYFDRTDKEMHDSYREHYSQKSEEFTVLMEGFTFVLPKEVIANMKGMPKYVETSEMQYYGYKDGKFSSRLAVDHQDMLWKLVLANGSSLQEAATSNGQIKFSLSLDLSLFCKYGVAVTDLISE